MRALNVALLVGTLLLATPSAVRADEACERLVQIIDYLGDGAGIRGLQRRAAGDEWDSLLRGSDDPYTHHITLSEKTMVRKLEMSRDKAASKFESPEVAREMLQEALARVDELAAGHKRHPDDWIRAFPPHPGQSGQLLRLSFNAGKKIGSGYRQGATRFDEPVRINSVSTVTLVLRRAPDRNHPGKFYYHVVTFYPDTAPPRLPK